MTQLSLRSLIVLCLLCTASALYGQSPEKTKAIGLDKNAIPTTHVTVKVDQPYTHSSADQANLNPKDPQFNPSGFLATKDQAAASMECILAQTVIHKFAAPPGLSASQIDSLCKAEANGKPTRYDDSRDNTGTAPAPGKLPRVDYAIVHVVRWNASDKAGAAPSPTDSWFLFNRQKGKTPGSLVPWKGAAFTRISSGTHMLGSNNVAFLSIHLGIDNTCGISYDIKATHTTPLNRQDFSSLIQAAVSILGSASSKNTGNTKSLAAENLFEEILPHGPLIVEPAGGLDFGDVPFGTTAVQTLVIKNTGGDTLSGQIGAEEPFSIDSGKSYSLAPGISQVVKVSFKPRQPEGNQDADTPFNAKLSFKDAQNKPLFTQKLTGTGVVAVGFWGGVVVLAQPNLPASIVSTPSMSGTVRAYGLQDTRADGFDPSVVATCSAAPKAPSNPDQAGNALGAVAFREPGRNSTASRHATLILTALSAPGQPQQPAAAAASPGAAQDPAKTSPANNAAGAKDPLSGSTLTIANEGIHHWDVSIAMPVSGYKSLKYDFTNNLLVPKTTTSVVPYALFDLFPFGVDLAGYSGTSFAISLPKLTAGVPIGNQPLQKPFVGTGFMGAFKSFRFQPMVGLHIQREQRADSPSSTATHPEWHAKLQVMIGFNIGDAKKVLGLK